MPRHLDPLPAALGAPFTRAEALRVGVHPGRLLRPDVIHLLYGCYARASSLDLEVPADTHPGTAWAMRQRALAAVVGPLLPEETFFSHRTAAALWRLPTPAPQPQEGGAGGGSLANSVANAGGLDVATFLPRDRPRGRGLHSVRLTPGYAQLVELGGLRVTDPASTWVLLAPSFSDDDAIALGDAVLHEKRIPRTTRLERPPLASIADLERLAAMPGRRGARRLRRLIPRLSAHCASQPESVLRLRLGSWNLPRPVIDFDVFDDAGRFIGCSEFAYPEYRVAVEYEGSHHRTDRRQWNRDIQKYHDYVRAGWEPIRVTAEMLFMREHEVFELVRSALRRRGWDGGL